MPKKITSALWYKIGTGSILLAFFGSILAWIWGLSAATTATVFVFGLLGVCVAAVAIAAPREDTADE